MSIFKPKTTAVLVDIFDNNIYSSKQSKWVNYFIIFLIIIATLEIILITEQNLRSYKIIFDIVYYLTSAIFLLEILLRFFVAGDVNLKYKGAKGKFLFILDFYTFIDLISILPFLLGFIGIELFPFLKALRVFRILKIMRYMPSVGLLQASIKNKQSELIISLQTIFILAVLLSIGLYYAESDIENSQFNSISQALLWSIAKFIGDIGGYGDFIPITITGKILATLNGILGIAIFALPAGILGSGFIEEIEVRKAEKELVDTKFKLMEAFKNEHLVKTIQIKERFGFTHLRRRLLKVSDIKYKLNIREDQLYDIVENDTNFRFRNFSSYKNDGIKQEIAVVEFYEKNSSYGTFKPSENPLIILSVSSKDQPFLGHFSYALSEILNCSYVSVESFSNFDLDSSSRKNFRENENFFIPSKDDVIEDFKNDLSSLSMGGKFIVHLAGKKSDVDAIEIGNGGKPGTLGFAEQSTFNNIELLEKFYSQLNDSVKALGSEVSIHKNNGIVSEQHVNCFLHSVLGFDVIQLYISQEILKADPEIYYNYLHCISKSLKLFNNK